MSETVYCPIESWIVVLEEGMNVGRRRRLPMPFSGIAKEAAASSGGTCTLEMAIDEAERNGDGLQIQCPRAGTLNLSCPSKAVHDWV